MSRPPTPAPGHLTRTRPLRAFAPFAVAAAILLSACAPLTVATVPLGDAGWHAPARLASLSLDPDHPALLQGFDGALLSAARVPSAMRTWNFLVPPGEHLLWVSGVPYGNPLLPQRLRCYTLRAEFEAGQRYVLSEDPSARVASLRREGADAPVATSALVDNPLVMERMCKWP